MSMQLVIHDDYSRLVPWDYMVQLTENADCFCAAWSMLYGKFQLCLNTSSAWKLIKYDVFQLELGMVNEFIYARLNLVEMFSLTLQVSWP